MSLKPIFCGPEHISRLQDLSLDLHTVAILPRQAAACREESRLGMLCNSTKQCSSFSKRCTILVETRQIPTETARAMCPHCGCPKTPAGLCSHCFFGRGCFGGISSSISLPLPGGGEKFGHTSGFSVVQMTSTSENLN